MQPPDAMVGGGGGSGGGSGGGNGGLVSNTPGATLVDVGNPATPSVVLLSSNFLQEPSGGQFFQQWLGEIKNTDATPICQVRLALSLRSAAGTQLASFVTFADADPYMLAGLPLSMGCIAPGQIGSLYSNAFAAVEIQLAAVTRIEVSFTVQHYPDAVPAPHAPLIASHEGAVFGTELGVIGTLTGVGGAIYNIGLDVYPRTASGLVAAQLFATDLDTLAPGAVFPFSTIGTSTPFTEYRQFADFIDGAKPAIAAPRSAPASAAADLEAARRDQRQTIRDRAALARAR